MSALRAEGRDEGTPGIAEVAAGEPTVGGFRFAATACGMRFVGRDDLGLIVCDGPAAWAGVYTTSSAPGAPVVVGRELLRKGKPLRAILVNAGIANAGTGKAGVRDCRRVAALVAKALGVREREVVGSSTGRIGPRIDVGKIEGALPALVEGLAGDRSMGLARAMMTSDSVPKRAVARCTVDGHDGDAARRRQGLGDDRAADGDDAVVPGHRRCRQARRSCRRHSSRRWARASTSWSSTATPRPPTPACCSPRAPPATRRCAAGTATPTAFRAALAALTADLARQLARDGEAATKLFVVQVRGAKSVEQARAAARAIAGSTLMKTSIGGGRLDWGRVIAALGSSGAQYVHERFTLAYGDAVLVRKGKHEGKRAAAAALAHLGEREIRLSVDLGLGRGEAEAFGCDLTEGYVRENSAPLPT